MQRFGVLYAIFMGVLCGCASPGTTKPASLQTYPLSANDLDFAVALARYSAGIAEEISEGITKGKSVDFFLDAATRDPSNYELVRKASIGLLYRRRTDEAAQLLETAISLNPTNYSSLLDLANVYSIADDSEKRASTYERAIRLAPSRPAAYIASAQSYLAEGQLDKALTVLERGAKQSNPEQMAGLALINAAALLKGGFPDRSITWFEFVSQHSKDNAGRIHVILADLFEGSGNRSKALEHYEKALRSPNPTADLFVKMAMLIGETDLESALMVLDRGEAVFPMNGLILSAIVYIAEAHEHLENAIALLKRIQGRTKNDLTADFYLHLGGAQEQAGEFKAAEDTFSRGLEAYPDSHLMLNYLAYMWAEKNINLNKGEQMVKRALELDPENGAYLDTLGWIYFMQGKNADAHTLIVRALKAFPEDPTLIDHLGDVLAKQGKIGEAVEQWKKSYAIDNSNEKVNQKILENTLPTEKDTDR